MAEFPRLHAYIEQLPSGLDSYPLCQAKGSLASICLDLTPLERSGNLPAEVVALVESRPLANSWIREVHYNALNLAIADSHGWSDARFGQFWHEVMGSITRSPMYRFAFGMISAETVVRAAGLRWSTFHRGTTLKFVRDPARTDRLVARCRLTAPSHVISRTLAVGYEQVILSFVQLSRQPLTTVQLESLTDTTALYNIEVGE